MATHTPGPWRFFTGEVNGKPGAYIDAEGAMIAESINPERIFENARLIAASPCLFDACKEALLQIEYLHAKFQPTGTGEAVLTRLRAAIARVETK